AVSRRRQERGRTSLQRGARRRGVEENPATGGQRSSNARGPIFAPRYESRRTADQSGVHACGAGAPGGCSGRFSRLCPIRQEQGRKGTFGEYESVMLERFDSLDRNHQGKLVQSGGRALSRPEFMKNIQSTFERIDRARDGGFTKAELQYFRMRLERERAAAARQRADSEFAKLDVNRNGRLSRAEFMAAAPAMPANLPDGRSLFA